MTDEQKKKYLKKKGFVCPYCGSGKIEAGKLSHNDDIINQEVECKACDKEWTDVYTLTGVK